MTCINHFKMKKFRNNIVFLGCCRATDLLMIKDRIPAYFSDEDLCNNN